MTSSNWYAWINKMPPKPDDLHVVGDIVVPNPGVEGKLCMKEPQGINPQIFQLDLHLVQQPGVWPPVMTKVQVRYDRVLLADSPEYISVEVFLENKQLLSMDVEIIA